MDTLIEPNVSPNAELGARGSTRPSTRARARARGSNDTVVADDVVVEGLTKRYGKRVAVDHLSFRVPHGAVAGLIGPNGAGKTTLMAMLLGLVRPSSGSGTVLGQSIERPSNYLPRVGASIESPAFHPAVSGIENLRSLAVLGGCDQAEIPELIELVGLTGRGDDRFSSYSMGMKQRLAIAGSLLGDPDVVILDEPTNGLDPRGMKDIRRLIGEIATGGRTLIVSSHLLGELEQVCDWLVVIDHGGLAYMGPPESLTGSESLVIRCSDPSDLSTLHSMVSSTNLPVRNDGSELVVVLEDHVDPAALAAEINRRAHIAGIALCELHYQRADLEARYLDLVSNGTEHANPVTPTQEGPFS